MPCARAAAAARCWPPISSWSVSAQSSTPLAAARAASSSGSSVPSDTTEWQWRSALRMDTRPILGSRRLAAPARRAAAACSIQRAGFLADVALRRERAGDRDLQARARSRPAASRAGPAPAARARGRGRRACLASAAAPAGASGRRRRGCTRRCRRSATPRRSMPASQHRLQHRLDRQAGEIRGRAAGDDGHVDRLRAGVVRDARVVDVDRHPLQRERGAAAGLAGAEHQFAAGARPAGLPASAAKRRTPSGSPRR